VSEAKKVELDRVAMVVTPRFEQTGSIVRGDAASRLIDVETKLELESGADAQVVARLVATAERMCFLMDAIRNPHPAHTRVALNGRALDITPDTTPDTSGDTAPETER